MRDKIVTWGLILSGPAFIIGGIAGLPWLTIAGAVLILPFGIVSMCGIIWNLIDR